MILNEKNIYIEYIKKRLLYLKTNKKKSRFINIINDLNTTKIKKKIQFLWPKTNETLNKKKKKVIKFFDFISFLIFKV